MTDLASLNFSNRDLRNRSFRGQQLNGADFSGSDIRGCDFSGAQLVAANFARVRTGQTHRQILLPIVLAGMGALVSANGVARMVFAALGETAAQSTWVSVVMLHLFTGIAGIGAASRRLVGLKSQVGECGMYLSGLCSGALMGFFYVGSYFSYNVQGAISGAVVMAGLVAVLSAIARRPMPIVILVMGAVAAYGFAFLIWTVAMTCFHVGRLGWGAGLGGLSLVYVLFAICALHTAGYDISHLSGTSFRGANITSARFDQATLKNTDFSKVIGWPR